MSNTDYTALANSIIKYVGGKENVTYFGYCTTRLRVNVKDRDLVKADEINKIKGVLGSRWTSDQLHIVIGADVADAYKKICEVSGFTEEEAIDEKLDDDAIINEGDTSSKKFSFKSLFSGMLDGLIGSVTPLIPMFIGGGMIRVIASVLSMVGVPADNTTYMVLSWVGDAFLYFFPIFAGGTAAKKFGANRGLGMLLGGILLSNGYINAVAAGTELNFLGLPIYSGSYASTIIPIILSVWVLSKVEHFVGKYVPKSLKTALVPPITLLITVPIMLVVTAPIGFYIGNYVSAAIIWFYNIFGFAAVAILAGFSPLIIMTGMHLGMIPVVINNYATLGYDPFLSGAGVISNFNQASACLAVAAKTKNKELRSTALSAAVTVLIAGITEPAMYAVTIKYKKPMVAAIIGGLVGGLYAGLTKVSSYALPANTGIFIFPTFIGGEGMSNLINSLIGVAIGMVVTFIATWVLGFEDEEPSKAISNV